MLTCGEKELLKMFKDSPVRSSHYMTYEEILINSHKHMSVSNAINLPVILHSLEHKNIVSNINMKLIILTKIGKEYLDDISN